VTMSTLVMDSWTATAISASAVNDNIVIHSAQIRQPKTRADPHQFILWAPDHIFVSANPGYADTNDGYSGTETA
jgi:hypothetical protein